MTKRVRHLAILLLPFLAACSTSARLQDKGHAVAGVGVGSLARFCSFDSDTTTSGPSRAAALSTPGNQNPLAGNLRFPIDDGCLSSPFGYRRGIFHSGLDITANRGDPIHACADGEVVFAGSMKKYRSYGLMVLIDHGRGLFTRYAHASKTLVKAGQKVKMGERIALVGKTGRATSPHLHLEIEVRGKLYNPLACFSDHQLRQVRIASGFPMPPLGPVRPSSHGLGRISSLK